MQSLVVCLLLLAAPPVARVDGVAITVSDLDRAVDFYVRTLSFEPVATAERTGDAFEHVEGVFGARVRAATLALGTERIELREFVAAKGRPFPADARGNDAVFQHIAIVVRDMGAAYARLVENDVVHASSAPQRLPDSNPNAGGIEAFYFHDPDGHWLELIRFPAGKGDPRWQAKTDRLFLGIDHTAIVVDDTERALGFWRDQLGLVVAGESENFGIEQEHLNGVFGARLRITGLRAPHGIGVELLDYLSPADGRPAPVDLRANDVVHWWTLVSGEPAQAAAATREKAPRWVSPGVVALEQGAALSLRDPDGHGVVVASSTSSGESVRDAHEMTDSADTREPTPHRTVDPDRTERASQHVERRLRRHHHRNGRRRRHAAASACAHR